MVTFLQNVTKFTVFSTDFDSLFKDFESEEDEEEEEEQNNGGIFSSLFGSYTLDIWLQFISSSYMASVYLCV